MHPNSDLELKQQWETTAHAGSLEFSRLQTGLELNFASPEARIRKNELTERELT